MKSPKRFRVCRAPHREVLPRRPTANGGSVFKSRERRRRDQAHRLAEWVNVQPSPLTWPGDGKPQILAVGRGILEEADPTLGPHVSDSVFVLTEEAFYYQFIEETPKELKSLRVRAAGAPDAEWAQLARESTACVVFRGLEQTDARRTVDGRWDLLFVPRGSSGGLEDYLGFGVIQCYRCPSLGDDDIAYLDRVEDVAHVVRLWNPTDVSRKLDVGLPVSMAEIADAYREVEAGPLGMMMPTPESMRMAVRMASEARARSLLIQGDDAGGGPEEDSPPQLFAP